MEALYDAIDTTPIIDHHAHNLSQSTNFTETDLLSVTSEATGPALGHSVSSLAHMRAIKQLAPLLGCEESWPAVHEALKLERAKSDDTWSRRCFDGIETVLIDDGLSADNVHPYHWHNRLTRSKCKRIVRIECVAEALIRNALRTGYTPETPWDPTAIINDFKKAISNALEDPDIAGFKSVICYRTGLAISLDVRSLSMKVIDVLNELPALEEINIFSRLEHQILNPFFVHLTAIAIKSSQKKKPFQFHTGLGDNDINLGLSNPSHLQPFIEQYTTVPIVLLHSSYPFTAEAGYLATMYANVYLDIGEVFPFVSQSGQEKIIQEALELCPSQKLTWSTDGHFYPETYLLAVIQVREGLKKVLGDFVRRQAVTVAQAITIVEAIFFKTSNELYNLNLDLSPFPKRALTTKITRDNTAENLHRLENFLAEHPAVRYLRFQWVDYTATVRVRVLPIKHALQLCRDKKFVGITKAVLGILQTDVIVSGFGPVGEYNLFPDYTSLKQSTRINTATLQCEFREHNNTAVPICPRTILRNQIEKATTHNLSLLIGSEIEVVFLPTDLTSSSHPLYPAHPINTGAHAWSTTRSLQPSKIYGMLETILSHFDSAGIDYQQFHSESGPGQYEFVLSPLPPLEAIDTLIAARDIISMVAAESTLRATLVPKPFPQAAGTGAHLHLSVAPEKHWPAFFAGVLKHLRAIAAFTYANEASYERVQDGVWAGGTWVCWGTQNRETPLRRIEGAHFEIKCVDGFANPYLALAAIVAAGVGGMMRREELRLMDCLVDPNRLSEEERKSLGITERLPKGYQDALQGLTCDRELRTWLGDEFVDKYISVKLAEMKMLEEMETDEKRRWLIERY